MTPGRARPVVALLPGLALLAFVAGGVALVAATVGAETRAGLATVLAPVLASHGMLAVGWWLAAAAAGAWGALRLHDRHVAAPYRLADAAAVLAGDPEAPEVAAAGGPGLRNLAVAINRIAAERRALGVEMAARVAEASGRVAEQRDQLAALMAELQQAVLVCNPEGRILLYNDRARTLLRAFSRGPASASGAEPVGLGRSVHAIVDRSAIAHALEAAERRRQRGETPHARFVIATAEGRLLQVSLAPVRRGAGGESGDATGYVLLLDDVTAEQEAHARADRRILELTESGRASAANIGAALHMLGYPDLEPADRERFEAVVRDEAASMSARLAATAAAATQDLRTRWPLQEMPGTDLLAAAARRIEDLGAVVSREEPGGDIWLNVDSFELLQAISSLAARLVQAGEATLRLRLASAPAGAHFDLVWQGRGLAPDALAGWQTAAIELGGEGLPHTVRDVIERHGGELWLGQDRARGESYFRFLLPASIAGPTPGEAIAPASRPAYYDFDLFAASDASRDLDARPLEALAYTVFDSETTGLDPAGGDEILQLGATRIVNGRILKGECFDQLVDPGRSIPEAGIAIHGISPEMVRGKPRIHQVLGAFHAFVADTVLVGHNVAFDLRFLKLKEAATGVAFDMPVLDTLLLASLVHPGEDSHGLEAIAGRLGIVVSGRHTAIGDALVTAEVFLKLVPLLRQRGITTLGAARSAAEASWYARLSY